jgi:hypothetical protein
MAEDKKQELDLETLAEAVGGGKGNGQENKNNRSAQQSNQQGNNYNDIMQSNEIKGNSGNVKVGSPVVIKNVGGGNTFNIG